MRERARLALPASHLFRRFREQPTPNLAQSARAGLATGTQGQEAKLGVLSTVLAAPAVTWLVFRAADLLPARRQIRAPLGAAEAAGAAPAPVPDTTTSPTAISPPDG